MQPLSLCKQPDFCFCKNGRILALPKLRGWRKQKQAHFQRLDLPSAKVLLFGSHHKQVQVFIFPSCHSFISSIAAVFVSGFPPFASFLFFSAISRARQADQQCRHAIRVPRRALWSPCRVPRDGCIWLALAACFEFSRPLPPSPVVALVAVHVGRRAGQALAQAVKGGGPALGERGGG